MTAAVVVTISQDAGEVENNVRYVPVDDAKIVAGALDNGDLHQIEEGSAGPEDNLLSAGQYLVLIGGSSKSEYFLADGLRGSFAIEGASAYERCPNPQDPSKPVEVKTGIVNQDELAKLFGQAIQTNAKNLGSESPQTP